MFRKLLSGATSTAVVAGLVSAGAVATAAPAAAVTPAAAPNPTLAGCGIPITLVLDASSSISSDGNPSEQKQVKDAAIAFLEGLKDTGSTSRVIQFSGTTAQISPRRAISSKTPPPTSPLQ
ncbi:MAG: hypothetical protein QM286_01385, partial [Acidobacteriota bacterium]|nr:hypothetical protein [Acidobacteriota bacterium]